jgi:hypothetical protein
MKLKLGLPFLLIVVGNQAKAQWLCRETSSVRSGQTITACGVGRSAQEEDARRKSRESAVEEFKRICNLSADCRDYDYTITPKRTECESSNDGYTCYRALEFEISNQKRSTITLDLQDIKNQHDAKRDETLDLQEKINRLRAIERAKAIKEQKNKELQELKDRLDQRESEISKLEDVSSKDTVEVGAYRYVHQLYKKSLKFSVQLWNSKLVSDEETDLTWKVSYERRPFSWLGAQVYGGFASGYLRNQKHQDSDIPEFGPRNTTEHYNGPESFIDLGVALLFYSGWKGVYGTVELGRVSGQKESYDVTYSSGVGKSSFTKGSEKFSSSYLGLHLGFDSCHDRKDWGVFFEIGGRKGLDRPQAGVIGTVGVNYGF